MHLFILLSFALFSHQQLIQASVVTRLSLSLSLSRTSVYSSRFSSHQRTTTSLISPHRTYPTVTMSFNVRVLFSLFLTGCLVSTITITAISALPCRPPKLEKVAEVRFELFGPAVQNIHQSLGIFPITGGYIKGDGFSGEIVAPSADWFRVRGSK